MFTTLWTFRTKNLKVIWSIAPSEQIDLSWDDTGEVREKLDSGEYEAFDSKMSVVSRITGEEIAADYLGESIYANPKDFRDHIGMNAKGHGSYFSDMVREACREARDNLRAMKEIPVRAKAA
jgi:hypothetical protein